MFSCSVYFFLLKEGLLASSYLGILRTYHLSQGTSHCGDNGAPTGEAVAARLVGDVITYQGRMSWTALFVSSVISHLSPLVLTWVRRPAYSSAAAYGMDFSMDCAELLPCCNFAQTLTTLVLRILLYARKSAGCRFTSQFAQDVSRWSSTVLWLARWFLEHFTYFWILSWSVASLVWLYFVYLSPQPVFLICVRCS